MLRHLASLGGIAIAASIVAVGPLAAVEVPVLSRTDATPIELMAPITPAPAVIDGVLLSDVPLTTGTVIKARPVAVRTATPPRRPSNLALAQKPKVRPAATQLVGVPAVQARSYVQVVQVQDPRRVWMTVGNGF